MRGGRSAGSWRRLVAERSEQGQVEQSTARGGAVCLGPWGVEALAEARWRSVGPSPPWRSSSF